MPLTGPASTLFTDPALATEIEQLRVTALRSRLLPTETNGRALFSPTGVASFNVQRLQRNLVLLNRAVQRLARDNPLDPDLTISALFVARSYEQLAELPFVDSRRLRMTAAIHYELAGYQANAATMARLSVPIPDASSIEETSIPQLASMFLQRRFLRCRVEGAHARRAPDVTDIDSEVLTRAATALTGMGLAHASDYFLQGDSRRLSNALGDLGVAHEALLDGGLALDANLLSGLRTLIPRLEANSTWQTLAPILETNALWLRYLKALGRGLGGSSALDTRSISELWPSQRAAIEAGVLEESSRVIRMPTGAGKTRIAEMAIVHALALRRGARALYVAPFNALTSEVESGFNTLFADLGLSLSTLTGSFDLSSVDEIAAQDDLLIVTPEKLDQLLRGDSPFLDELDIVILDEGHIVGDEQRGPKYELTITRLRQRRPNARFVALSAVVPDETLVDFSRWLNAASEPISSTWRPTIQRLARLRWRDAKGDLVYSRDVARGAGEAGVTVERVIETEPLPYRHPVTLRMRRPAFPEPDHRAQVAAAYAWRVIDQGPVLVYCQKPQDASAVARALSNRLEWGELRGDVIPRSLSYRRRRSAVVAEEWLGADHEITQRLLRGVAVHFAALPEAVKNAIEDDFRNRELNVLAATGTLAQGVNLPVRTLVVHTTRRYDEDLRTTVQMPARDFWNIAGRVGRAGAETEGTVVFLDFNQTDKDDFEYYIQSRRAVEPVDSALLKLLDGLVSQRISANDVARQLDPEMLALLVEENDQATTATGVSELLGSSLFSVQAQRAERDPQPMWDVMSATSRAIASRIPEPETRILYAGTGLSAVSCLAIHDHIQTARESLSQEFNSAVVGSTFLQTVLSGLTSAREMSPRYSVDASHSMLLEAWMEGDNVGKIAASFDLDPVELTRFIEDYFGYRLPWGVSGYMTIAADELQLGDLPRHFAALPALIRYGVPRESAAWAMALGVPSRSVALTLGRSYEASATTPTSSGLRRWLARLDPDDLSEQTGLPPEALAATTKAVLRAHGNDILRRHYEGQPLLPIEVTVSLFKSERARAVWEMKPAPQLLNCVRDYDSYNRNAVVVSHHGVPVGRLPRIAAEAIALEMDGGKSIVAVSLGGEEVLEGRMRFELRLIDRANEGPLSDWAAE